MSTTHRHARSGPRLLLRFLGFIAGPAIVFSGCANDPRNVGVDRRPAPTSSFEVDGLLAVDAEYTDRKSILVMGYPVEDQTGNLSLRVIEDGLSTPFNISQSLVTFSAYRQGGGLVLIENRGTGARVSLYDVAESVVVKEGRLPYRAYSDAGADEKEGSLALVGRDPDGVFILTRLSLEAMKPEMSVMVPTAQRVTGIVALNDGGVAASVSESNVSNQVSVLRYSSTGELVGKAVSDEGVDLLGVAEDDSLIVGHRDLSSNDTRVCTVDASDLGSNDALRMSECREVPGIALSLHNDTVVSVESKSGGSRVRITKYA